MTPFPGPPPPFPGPNLQPTKPGLHLVAVSFSPTGNPHAQGTVVLKLTVQPIEPEKIESRLDGKVLVSADPTRPSDFDGTVSFLILKTDVGNELVYHFRAAKPDGDLDIVTSRLWKLQHDIKLLDVAVSATQAETYNHEIWLTYEQQDEKYLLRLRQNGPIIVGLSKLVAVESAARIKAKQER